MEPSSSMIYQYDLILDSDFTASEVSSSVPSFVIILEVSANGWPLTCTLYDFVQPNGARCISKSVANDSICFKILNAVLGEARFELRCAYGYKSNFLHPTFFIESWISLIAFRATVKSSPSSTAINATTISSNRFVSGWISSAAEISFFVGVYSISSQCNCKIRTA